jgi:small subunit ribosomal protein S6
MTKANVPQGAESDVSLYELMIIWNPELRESEQKKRMEDFEDMIEKGGGKFTQKDFWGKRPLAYRIKAKSDGVYMVYNVELPTHFIKEVRELLRIDKEVVRSMILTLPAGHTYTKFDLTMAEEPKKKDFFMKKNVSIKHSGPMKTATAPKEETKEKGKEANAVDLDKRLDAIIGGSDLKL